MLYPRGNITWQDDPSKIHRARVPHDTAQQNLTDRLDYERQAQKMTGVWTVENAWALLQVEFKAMNPQIKEELRISIKKSWARMDKKEDLCKKLIGLTPTRL